MKTYSAKNTDITRKWYIIDASQQPLGRVATSASSLLLGKSKPLITAHVDCGDYVIVINTDKLVVTGNKMTKKVYYRHSGYPGGLKEMSLADKMKKDSKKVIYEAIRGMLPVNKLRAGRLLRLKIYVDDKHTHEPQKPEVIKFKEK